MVPSDPPRSPDCVEQEPASDAPSIHDNASPETPYKLHRRFDRLGRLFGDEAVKALLRLRVAVFGLGGVGSFAAEALARSAVGHLALVDFDDVCVTNSNRQLQALQGTVGKPKAWVLRDRLRLVNPQARIEGLRLFYNAKRSEELFRPPWPEQDRYDAVVDCIDNISAKAHLLATCRARGIPVVSAMGAAGKFDPLRIKVADLAEVFGCHLAKDLRKILRRRYGFPREGPLGVRAVFSDEPRTWPRELHYDEGRGFRCVCGHRSDEHSCDARSVIDGTVAYVTGAFGLACASVVVNTIAEPLLARARPAPTHEELAHASSAGSSPPPDDDPEPESP